MQKYVGEEFLPGPSAQSDQDCLDHIRQTAGTTYHPTSTCMMGSRKKAVVDTALRVPGVEGCRVVDASIMPAVVSGNTNAATIMIAEKGAERSSVRHVTPVWLLAPKPLRLSLEGAATAPEARK